MHSQQRSPRSYIWPEKAWITEKSNKHHQPRACNLVPSFVDGSWMPLYMCNKTDPWRYQDNSRILGQSNPCCIHTWILSWKPQDIVMISLCFLLPGSVHWKEGSGLIQSRSCDVRLSVCLSIPTDSLSIKANYYVFFLLCFFSNDIKITLLVKKEQ